MKKITTLLLVVLALVVLTPSFTAFACDCDCENCKDCKKTVVDGAPEKLMNARDKALKTIKSVAKKFNWNIATETVKSTAKKLWTKVTFDNPVTHKLMELQLRVENSKAAWYFQEKGKWVKTTVSGIKKVLKDSGKKATTSEKAKTLSDVTFELFQPVADYGSGLGWMSELSVEDEDTDYRFCKVHFWNVWNGYTLDVEIHAEKSASGAATAEWYFLSKDGTYKRSSSDLIKEVLNDYSGKDL